MIKKMFSTNTIKKLHNKVLTSIGQLLECFKLLPPRVIVRVDGGICSQIHFFLIGKLFEEKGYKVEYDLSWFKDWGKDNEGKFSRNFDFKRLFPNVCFKESSKLLSEFYKRKYNYVNDYFDTINPLKYSHLSPPLYLNGYYRDPQRLYTEMFTQYLPLTTKVLDEENLKVLGIISSKMCPVCIHVRRGDLSSYNPAYGNPASLEYFNKAIKHINEIESEPYFFFFSDEPNWVKESLIPQLPIKENYFTVDINGSDKGYMDLILMSNCKHFISSKGSLAKYAFCLNHKKDSIMTICDEDSEDTWKDLSSNILIIEN